MSVLHYHPFSKAVSLQVELKDIDQKTKRELFVNLGRELKVWEGLEAHVNQKIGELLDNQGGNPDAQIA